MGHILSYSIMSGILLLVMSAVYRLFLAGDTRHAYNRAIILAIYAISFLLFPLIGLLRPLLDTPQTGATILEYGFTATISAAAPDAPAWGRIAVLIFMGGMVAIFMRTAITWARIMRIIAKGQSIDKGHYTLVLTDDEGLSPFSWLHYMVMSRSDYASCPDAIIAHELRHIVCWHWIDLLVAQIVVILNWFNPAAWLMRSQLMLVHEYQADRAVIDSCHDPKEYQLLLIKKAVGARLPSLANSLNHSKLKKRITMMYKSKSSTGARFKALALAPAAVAAMLLAGMPQVKAAIATIENSDDDAGKVSDISSAREISASNFKIKSINNANNRTTVVITGTELGNSLTVSDMTLTSGGKTCRSNGMHTEMTGGNATITAEFPLLAEFSNSTTASANINGRNITISWCGNNPSAITTTTIATGNTSATITQGNPTILVDGKEASSSELNNISPDNISGITVDKNNNFIYITLKK